MPHHDFFEKLSKTKVKLIKSLGFKKFRLQENAFVVEGAKNIEHLLASDYVIRMVVGTADFLALHHDIIAQRTQEIFQADQKLLATLGNFQSNNTGLAVATPKPNIPVTISQQQYSLVLDGIQDPGNLGTIIRIADWYGISVIVCSLDTVELYNPKVLQASMGSFTNVRLYYTELVHYLSQVKMPIVGTFTTGENLHQAVLPAGGLVVIGHETRGISEELMPYIQQRVSIPKYGKAESLNAAVATAVVCDSLRRVTKQH
jgi:RNA methyltransferase, TrmH family